MSRPTYDSKCMKCLCGTIHPFHDNGEIADGADAVTSFSQLPPETPDRLEAVVAEERKRVVHDH